MNLQDFYQSVKDGKKDVVLKPLGSIRLGSGKTIEIKSDKVKFHNGLPVINNEDYIRRNHPEHLSEYQRDTASQQSDFWQPNYSSMGVPS